MAGLNAVLALSAVAVTLGGLTLVSTLSNPSLDLWIVARDLSLSAFSLSIGVAAPFLYRKFRRDV
ncbi:MAG: hypothetical protein ACK4M3_05760 [Pyrobaculum sp.]